MMRHRVALCFFVVSSAAAAAIAVGCSAASSSLPVAADAGEDTEDEVDVPGDATHKDEQPVPSATYACAIHGGFGWSCTLTATGPDSAECTDPRFPVCFVGAQGGRCTALCGDAGLAGCPAVSAAGAGCVPTECNARGYCK